MRLPVTAAAAAAVLCLAAQAHAQPSSGTVQGNTPEPASPATAPAPPTDTPGYLRLAGQSDAYEIQAAQMQLARGKDPKVKAFANQMIHDHTQSTDMLLAAAHQAGIPAARPTTLDPRHQSMLAQLKAAPSPDFDRVYLEQQLPAHQEALQLHQHYAQSGETPALRATAAKIVPVVQQHITMLGELGAR